MQCPEKVGPGEVRQGLGEHGGHPGITGTLFPEAVGNPGGCAVPLQKAGLWAGAGGWDSSVVLSQNPALPLLAHSPGPAPGAASLED